MKTPFSRPAARNNAREFRIDLVPRPSAPDDLAAAARIRSQAADGGSIDLEIGCGVGWHPIRYARENPERTLIAIERTSEKFGKFRERLARNPALPNLVPVHADAIAWVAHHVPDSACDRIFLLYPNPNPKNAAARWVRMPFFPALVKKLRPGGRLELRTNIADYDAEFREHAPTAGLSLAAERKLVLADIEPKNARTHFERKYLERGETCLLSEWTLSGPGTLR